MNIPHEPDDDDQEIIYCSDGPWVMCWSCGGEGFHELYDDDPLWYDEDDIETCDVCEGKGGWPLTSPADESSDGQVTK